MYQHICHILTSMSRNNIMLCEMVKKDKCFVVEGVHCNYNRSTKRTVYFFENNRVFNLLTFLLPMFSL
jgi:hypothetical protein